MGCVSPSFSEQRTPHIRLSTSLQQSCSRGRAGHGAVRMRRWEVQRRGFGAPRSGQQLPGRNSAPKAVPFVLQGGSCTQQELPGEEGRSLLFVRAGGNGKQEKLLGSGWDFALFLHFAAQCSNYYFSLECLFRSVWTTLSPRADFSRPTYHTPFITRGGGSAPCSQQGRTGRGVRRRAGAAVGTALLSMAQHCDGSSCTHTAPSTHVSEKSKQPNITNNQRLSEEGQ